MAQLLVPVPMSRIEEGCPVRGQLWKAPFRGRSQMWCGRSGGLLKGEDEGK